MHRKYYIIPLYKSCMAEKMTEIIKFDPLSMAKIEGLILLIMGTIIGVIYFLVLFFTGNTAEAIIILISAPLTYGVLGFICVLIFAALYNWLAKKIGGIKVELK